MPLLSILIASVPSRRDKLNALFDELKRQSEPYGDDVEILVFLDNKKRTIGAKRQALLDIALGDYVTWIDDDDKPSEEYIDKAIEVLLSYHPDVITFNQHVYINGQGAFDLTFKLGHEVNEEVGETPSTRPPWHVCIWNRRLVRNCRFPDSMYGEDWSWAEQANKEAQTSRHIDHVMLTYIFDSTITEAL